MTGRDTGDAEGRSAFRAFVRAHHPDVGGDPAEFAAGLARFRAESAGPAPGGSRTGESEVDSRYDAPVSFVVNRRGIAAVVARFRRRRRPPRVR